MKKKVSIVICSFFIFLLLSGGVLKIINNYYDNKINSTYYDEIGNSLLLEKNQGLMLQESAIGRKDTVTIFGSSELSSTMIPTHPANFFKNKSSGFQVNLVGRGYSQSIVHAINFQALRSSLKDKKVVVIISPQWFTPKGLNNEGLAMNFSELQFYKLMFDDNIDKNIKIRTTERLTEIINNSMELGNIKLYSYLYSRDNIISKTALQLLMPYYKMKYYILLTKDKIKTYNILKQHEGSKSIIEPIYKKVDWKAENEKINIEVPKLTNNNQFDILNDYYDTYIKYRVDSLKNSYKADSFLESPEYGDLQILLDTCKSIGVKPLFVSVPVHGTWYDYGGFDKNDRAQYYKKVEYQIHKSGFEVLNLSKFEYEKYTLKDIMHLGWKGWLNIDEQITKYYNQN